jgi:hypothetical protein
MNNGLTITVTYHLLAPLLVVLEEALHFKFEVEYGDDETPQRLVIFHSRFAMDGAGGIVGYEDYETWADIHNRSVLGLTAGVPVPACPFVVNLKDTVSRLISHPEVQEYTVEDAKQFLADDADWQRIVDADGVDSMTDKEILEFAFDKGMDEMDYCPSPDDFVQQECQHLWDEVLKEVHNYPCQFLHETRQWVCGDEVLWDLPPNEGDYVQLLDTFVLVSSAAVLQIDDSAGLRVLGYEITDQTGESRNIERCVELDNSERRGWREMRKA